MRKTLLPFLVAALLAPATRSGAAADDFAALFATIIPSKDESAWQEIPWHVDLHEARKQARELGRPVFLWEMDGHPLGCT